MSALAPVQAPVVAVAAATTLTAAQSGSIISLTSAAADFTVSLPAPASGLNYKFVIAATAGTNQVQITATGTQLIGWKTLSGTTTADTTAHTNAFLGNSTGPVASTVGDRIEMYCDGSRWLWVGYGTVAASIRTT